MTLEEVLRYHQGQLAYYRENLEHHGKLDTSRFSPEQLKVYKENVKKFKRKIELYSATISFLILVRREVK